MIRYELKCQDGHRFEAWFQNGEAYDRQRASGVVACALCGSGEVEKALMAPALGKGARPQAAPAPAPAAQAPAADAPAPTLSAPADHPVARALAALRAHVEKTAEYVGRGFAEEARRIHRGDTPDRAIWGEATGAEAKALAEEGVPVAPLPYLPRRDD